MTKSLFVGDQVGTVAQYQKENDSFSLVKNYGHIGVGIVSCSALVGGFVYFRRNQRHCSRHRLQETTTSGRICTNCVRLDRVSGTVSGGGSPNVSVDLWK